MLSANKAEAKPTVIDLVSVSGKTHAKPPAQKWPADMDAEIQRRVGEEVARIITEYLANEPDSRPVTVSKIIDQVSQKYMLSRAELISQRHAARIVFAKHELFWRARNETSKSLPQIGMLCGGFDHTSVIYGIRKYEHYMAVRAGRAELKPSDKRYQNYIKMAIVEASS